MIGFYGNGFTALEEREDPTSHHELDKDGKNVDIETVKADVAKDLIFINCRRIRTIFCDVVSW